ncbi:MAG: hypothetical protein AAGC55_09175, partial [Myxococcota bacterium]
RVVVGNPDGALLRDTYVELRDPFGRLVDALEIGGNSELVDRGGDGVMNGAPEAGADGYSSGLADETIARVPDGGDSGDDAGDFAHATASPGAPN